MRNILLIHLPLFFIFVCNGAFPQETQGSRMHPKMELGIQSMDMMAPEKMYKMQEMADFLGPEERYGLYNQYHKVPGTKVAGLLLNMGLPGLGSLIIGDGGGALAVSLGVLGGGGIGTLALFSLTGLGPVYSYDTAKLTQMYFLTVAMAAGYSVAGLFYIGGLVTPFFFSDNYNKQLALSLKIRQKELVSKTQKPDLIVPEIANILLGFGVGSFAQGDMFGGLIGLGGDICGIGCIIVGLGSLYYPTLGLSREDPSSERAQDFRNQIQTWNTVTVIGGVVFGLSKLFGIIRPFWFSADYDNGLVTAIPGNGAFAFKPYVVPALTEQFKPEMRFGLNAEIRL